MAKNVRMMRRFDDNLLDTYGNEYLKKVCNANIKLVSENIILSIKSALLMEHFPAVTDSCHHLLGWNLENIAYFKSQGCPLNAMFGIMKGTFQPSCETICIDPDSHFQKCSCENKCYPIGKVFEVLFEISVNAANKLLDEKLVVEVYQQIKMKEVKETLKIFSIDTRRVSQSKPPRNSIENFQVLLINMDLLLVEDRLINFDTATVAVDDTSEKLKNLIDNLQNNFLYILLEKPASKINSNWEKHVANLHNRAKVIVILFSSKIMNSINKWKPKMIPKQYNTINSVVGSNDFQSFEHNQLDKSMRYVHAVWKKICSSDKLKICVSFESDLMKSIHETFPMTFYLPDEMKKMLVLIKEMIKQ